MKKTNNNSILKRINDPFDILLGQVNNRMSNAFTGSYILSVLALNWKLFIFLIASNKEIEKKFIYIYEDLYPNVISRILMFIVFPLIIALVYSFIIPWLTEQIDSMNNKYKIKNREREQEKITEILTHNIDASILLARAEMAKANVQSNEEFNEKIKSLENSLKESNDSIERLTLEKETELKEKQDLSKRIIETMSEKEDAITEIELLKVYFKSTLEKTLLSYRNTGNIHEFDIYPLINDMKLKDERFGLELMEMIKQSLEKVYLYTVEISPVEGKTSTIDTIHGILRVKWDEYQNGVYLFTTTHTNEKELTDRLEHLRTLPYIKSVKAELFNG